MKSEYKNNGSVMIITLFVIALLAVLVTGMLQANTEEIQLMRNHIYAGQAMAVAEAGLNDALSEIRADSAWTDGFTDKAFAGGSYTVGVTGSLPNLVITSTGTNAQSYSARIEANVTVGSISPYIIRIDEFRVNE